MRLFFLTTLLLLSFSLTAQTVTQPPSGNNQKCEVTQYIGSLVKVTINYSSPNVTGPNGQDRTGQIWGQLVPYGLTDLGFGLQNPSPWRAGANENTTISFSHDVEIQGQKIQAGTYGLHLIVEESQPWTIILSHNHTAWGSFFYKESEDALRVTAEAEDAPFAQWLTYSFTDRQPDQCTVAMRWENKKLPFTIKVPEMTEVYLANMRQELESTAGFNWQGWNQAANYCLQQNTNLEEALTWAENAVALPFIGQANFNTLSTKAQLLYALDRKEEAETELQAAIAYPGANSFQIHVIGRQMIGSGDTKMALKVFEANHQRFEGAWPTEVGMARGLSAVGRYADAVKHAEIALSQAPDQLNKDNLVQMIENLKAGKDVN
ncbi:MAG: DUF2911 domain-containing protein [Lewinella sp.]|jgi:tetratricopeptide (TPR) repeat protein|uniref:DUF2911 domain-containing protein n=1 Tax=Lewinella sp. TaxID=2004506 RepID=UPI003D6B3E6B